MAVQQSIAHAHAAAQVGRTLSCIIDMPSPQAAAEGRGDVWLGRTMADAPDIDCVVYVTPRPDRPLAAGEILPVEIVAASGYDLAGVPA